MNTAPGEKDAPGREGGQSQVTSWPQPSRHWVGNLDPERALEGLLVMQLTT